MADKKELDDFWDIDSLIPEKKNEKIASVRKASFDTSVTDVEDKIPPKSDDAVYSGSSFTRFIPPHTAEEYRNLPKPQIEYKLAHSLVHEVKIYATDSKYNFYDRFFDDAVRLRDKIGEDSQFVPFFSYTPQYSQMNRAQLAYYLWWRENARKGVYLNADYSYVLLYLYEIINLSEISDKKETLDTMCNIWLRYGDEHPFVSKYLGEWVCDFCLINRLPVPSEKLRPLYPSIMKNCLIKEFYVVGGGAGKVCADTLVEIASAYDYRKSRCATDDRLPILRKHLVGALDHVLSDDGVSNPLLDGMRNNVADNTAIRTSYSGALCTARIRRKIEIRYYSFSRSYELRYLISDIMKYSENRLRKIWGIKSRLSIYALPTSIKKRIDEYFDSLMPTFKAEQISREIDKMSSAEYEKLYDIPRTPLSPENASRIEENSWETTKILIETFGNDTESVSDETNLNKAECPKEEKINVLPEDERSEQETDFITALGDKAEFLFAVLNKNTALQRESATRLSMLSEAVVDEINELAADMLGDILIEDDGEGFAVIEDYRDTVEAILEKQRK